MSEYNRDLSLDDCIALSLVGKYAKYKGITKERLTAFVDNHPVAKYPQPRQHILAGYYLPLDDVLRDIQKLNEKRHDMVMTLINELIEFGKNKS